MEEPAGRDVSIYCSIVYWEVGGPLPLRVGLRCGQDGQPDRQLRLGHPTPHGWSGFTHLLEICASNLVRLIFI